ncbi:unnamed protein product [Rhizoctonia solani]|uniref:Protein kinase domain-containing protein n=1 Tax=Rhizoctonia solani TaxID=456999 RepID=A0A8H3HD81_9AGAM|nr:unnamed protein product [Rhizoctonia solani]
MEATSPFVNGAMPVSQIVALLSSRGCKDVTEQLDLNKTTVVPTSGGGQGDIYKGELTNGTEVAVKIIRIAVSSDSHEEKKLKGAAHELYIWTKCKHRNILELIGMATFHGSLAMVSPWVGNSDLSWFLSQNLQVDRYKICAQVAEGVAHMHLVHIVHGDIKCGNILVSHDHVPKLMDFGSSTLKREYTMKFKVSSGQPAFSLRWAAPELLPDEDEVEPEPTFGSDIYALGMTFLIQELNIRNHPHTNQPENESRALSSLVTQCALTLSEVTKELAPIPAIGPLVGCLTGVFQAVERSKVNKDQWKLLRGRCVMILRIAGAHVENYGKEHFHGLQEAATMLEGTLNRVQGRARHYNEMNELVAFALYQTISNDIQVLFAELDTCLKFFNFSIEAAQEQWTGEYQAVQKREARELQQLRGELEKMNVSFDAFNQDRHQMLGAIDRMFVALKQVLDDKSMILQDQRTATVDSYVDAQQIVRTILSVTSLQLPPKLLLGKQCTLDAPTTIKTGITCDIYQASFLGGEKVAKKVFRIGASDKEYVEKYATRFLRIAALWSEFRSDYLLPFYGIGVEPLEGDNRFQLYMISPLMRNFDAMTFLNQHRDNQGMKRNMLRIITDAAKGLQYLHNRLPPVVHSGMRGDNILITDSEGGILGGFGLTKAPEMLDEEYLLETPCDVWGCARGKWHLILYRHLAKESLKIISGSIPYHMIKQSTAIIIQVGRGPPRREHHAKWEEYAYRPDEMWDLLQKCWAMEPQDRPTMDDVVAMLKEIAKMPQHQEIIPISPGLREG